MAAIVMPRLSDTMEEGTILRWLKADGDQVARGEELVEIETDKATMTYESDQGGVLRILAAEGDTLTVGEPIAHVGEEAAREHDSDDDDRDRPTARAEEPRIEEPSTDEPEREQPRADEPEREEPRADEPDGEPGIAERVKASPLARRIAREAGVDLHALSGSGPGGRIVKADVEHAPAIGEHAAAGASAATGGTHSAAQGAPTSSGPAGATPAALADVATAKGDTTIVELNRTQQTIARRMAESKATIPDFTLVIDVDMEACVSLRSELKRLSASDAPTYNDMVVKATALALRESPRANGSYRDARVQVHSRVNVGVAVAAHDSLVVPTVFDADEKSLGEIAREARQLAARVRDGSITPPELGGGTFTVSNLGMYGVRSFTAIINPPQAGILSVGALAPRAVVAQRDGERAGELVARNTLTLTLACDHRILYGAEAAQFLARIGELLEAPASLTL